MFPIASEFPVRGRSPVTWSIIALCALIAVGQLADVDDDAIFLYGARPALIAFDIFPLNADSPAVAFTLLSSMFLHAGVLHVVGNMLFFHCFSMPVETLMGSWRYAVFYILCGVSSTLVHAAAQPGEFTPLVGASGAVAGVLAAHTVLLPWTYIRVPEVFGPGRYAAWIFTALWVGYQAIYAIDQDSNVAWIAHLGGIAAGIMLAPIFCLPGVRLFSHGPAGTYDDGNPPGDRPPLPAAAAASSMFRSAGSLFGASPSDTLKPPVEEDGIRLGTLPSAALAVFFFAIISGWLANLQNTAPPAVQAKAYEWIALSRIYGMLVPYDPQSGLVLYREAAKLDPNAALRLGKQLRSGKDLPKNDGEAIDWFKRAAELKQPEAMEIYAMALLEGAGTPADREKGEKILRDLALDSFSSGDLRLGMILEQGLGGAPVDLEGAAKHYELACYNKEWRSIKKTGVALACYRLSLMMFKGIAGVPRDVDHARQLLRNAAAADIPAAQNALALMLINGDPEDRTIGPQGTPNDAEARRLLKRAASAGDKEAAENLAALERRLPPGGR